MREQIERRLLVVACIGGLVGIAAKANVWNLVFLPALVFFLRPPTAKAVTAAACALWLAFSPAMDLRAVQGREFYTGLVTVLSVPRVTRAGTACEVDAQGARMDMRIPRGREVGLGDRIAVRAVVDPPNESETGLFESRGLVGRMRPFDMEVVRPGLSVFRWASSWRESVIRLCSKALERRPAAAVDALCFNVDSDIDRGLQSNLRRTGTIHVVSASGLHVVIVAFALLWLLERLPIPRRFCLAVVSVALFLYVGAAGLNPPVVRAAAMAVLVLGAYLFRREPDWLSALALAALGCMVVLPSSVMEAGFQLSFAVIAGLGLFGRRSYGGVGAFGRLWTGFKNIAHVAIVASVVSAPLVAYHFGMISLVSVLANVLIAFVIAPIVIATLVAQAVSPVSAALAAGLMKLVVEPLSGWFLWVVDSLGQMRWAAVDTPPFSAYWLIPIYGAMLCLWRKRVREA